MAMVGHGDSKKVDEKAKTLVGKQMCMKNWKWDIRWWGDIKLKMQILFSHAALELIGLLKSVKVIPNIRKRLVTQTENRTSRSD